MSRTFRLPPLSNSSFYLKREDPDNLAPRKNEFIIIAKCWLQYRVPWVIVLIETPTNYRNNMLYISLLAFLFGHILSPRLCHFHTKRSASVWRSGQTDGLDWYNKRLQFGPVSFQICPVAFTLSHQLCQRVTVYVCVRHVSPGPTRSAPFPHS